MEMIGGLVCVVDGVYDGYGFEMFSWVDWKSIYGCLEEGGIRVVSIEK
jgi:hypothetical protein